MNSTVIVNIDRDLKEKAMKMAKKEGLTMKALLSFLLKWYTKKEIEINASFSQHKRNNDVEIEDFSKEEIEILETKWNFKNLTNKLNDLIIQKWI